MPRSVAYLSPYRTTCHVISAPGHAPSCAAEARSTEVAPAAQQLVESRNVAFSGTVMVQGRFVCVVFGTGDSTVIGEIAAKIRTSRTRSSLEIQIEHFVHIIAFVAVAVGCLSLVAIGGGPLV